MPNLSITPDLNKNPWSHLSEIRPPMVDLLAIGRLPQGMQSGKSTVSFHFCTPEGEHIIAQTSLALLQGAMIAFSAAEARDITKNTAG